MANSHKYYHNDYKRLMGVDESRTASEKLLDKAIGGVKPVVAKTKQEHPPEKKVKEEHSNLSHLQILAKVMKSVESNQVAAKLLKPLALLKKCLQDPVFIAREEINNYELMSDIVRKLIEIDEKVVGNYSEINLVYEALLEILSLLLICLNKLQKLGQSKQVKEEAAQQGNNQIKLEDSNLQMLRKTIKICQIQILFYKLFTDDNFSFNKTLIQFKKIYFGYFQGMSNKQKSKSQDKSFSQYLQNMLIKLMKLPYTKHQWVKSSLSQFFKDFNITHKHLLNQQFCDRYLQSYNAFLNHKLSRGAGEEVNMFGNGGKGGKYTQLEAINADGFDKWTSKQ